MGSEKIIEEISVFFLAYNEEGNIVKLIDKADRILDNIAWNYEIIIVYYKGSTDNTEKIIKALMKRYSHLRIIYQEVNEKGYGAALKLGINASKFKYVFYTDGDLQFDIKEIEKLIPYAKDYDIITGYRQHRQDPITRIITSKIYNLMMTLVFGFKVKDIDCAFKIFNKRIFDKIKIDSITGMALTEIYAKSKKYGFKIKEVPITHYPRLEGKSIFESKFALVQFSVVKNLLKEMKKLKKDLKN